MHSDFCRVSFLIEFVTWCVYGHESERARVGNLSMRILWCQVLKYMPPERICIHSGFRPKRQLWILAPKCLRIGLKWRTLCRDLFVTVFHPDPEPRQTSVPPLPLQGWLHSPSTWLLGGGVQSWLWALFLSLLWHTPIVLVCLFFLRLAHYNQCSVTLTTDRFPSSGAAFSFITSVGLCLLSNLINFLYWL